MRHVGFSISTPGQQSPFCYWFTESQATVSQKSRRAAGQRHSEVRAHSKRITGTTRLRTFWSSIVVHRLRINKAASAFFPHASRRSVMGGTGGGGGGETVYSKSIYLPMLVGPVLTAVDGSFYKAFCGEGRWCLNQPGENGMAQNNGVIEEH